MLREAWAAFQSLMGQWHAGKMAIEANIAVAHDALHVIFGMLAWIAIALVMRRPLSSWRPFGWLFALILWNEAVDLWVEIWPDHAKQFREGGKDLLLTILLPALLTLLIRTRPKLFAATRRR